MKRFLAVMMMLSSLSAAWAAPPPVSTPPPAAPPGFKKIVPNDPKQNPLMASGSISAGLSDTLDAGVKVKVLVSNPTMVPVTFQFAEAIFVLGSQQKGHPIYAERIDAPVIEPGQTITMRFRYGNPKDADQVSAYVLLQFVMEGNLQRTALFIPGPKQLNFADRWQQKFFPYGHYTGFFSTTDYVQAPYWGDWDMFSPFWW